MARKVHQFPEDNSRTQTHTLTLPNLREIYNVSVNTGNVSVQSVDGDEVTLRFTNGSYTRRVQTGGNIIPSSSKTVTDYMIAATMSGIPSTMSYNRDGYSGTLYKTGSVNSIVVDGDYYPAHTKNGWGARSMSYDSYATHILDGTTSTAFPNSIPYNQDGYTGTLYKQGGVTATSPDAPVIQNYGGTVTRPAKDTRVWEYQQFYTGTVTKPGSDTRTWRYYYRYTVTIDYEDFSAPPVKVNGVWREVPEVYVKVGGIWRKVTNVYGKVNGVWKEHE